MKNKDIIIAPSILSADFSKLAADVKAVEDAGAQWLHIDVMDGSFVPNITIGPVVVKSLRPHSKLVFDVHLMIDRPDKYWERFAEAGADIITFHAEADVDKKALIADIKARGLKAGVSVKPGSGADSVLEYFDDLDLILVMTVEPGFGGQKFMEDMVPKISAFREKIDRGKGGCVLEVDGGIDTGTAPAAVKAGADALVAGNSVFGKGRPSEAVAALFDSVKNLKNQVKS